MSVRTAPTLEDVQAKQDQILQVLASKGARNPRVFGSVARGDAVPESDIDLLVEFEEPRPHGWEYFGVLDELQRELASVLGRPVHLSEAPGESEVAERIRRDAVPLVGGRVGPSPVDLPLTTERDRLHLTYIQESITRIGEYTSAGKQRFLRDTLIQDAVLRRLETLADAASKLPPQIMARHPSVPWRKVYNFRNRVAHGYTDVDFEVVWHIVVQDLPMLKAAVELEMEA